MAYVELRPDAADEMCVLRRQVEQLVENFRVVRHCDCLNQIELSTPVRRGAMLSTR